MASSGTGRRKFSMKHPVVVDVGCSCRRTRLISSLFSTAPPKPKFNPQTPPNHHHPLSSYYPFSPSTNTNLSTTTISSSTSPYEYSSSSPSWTTTKNTTNKHKKKPLTQVTKQDKHGGNSTGRVVTESVAVVKESDDPYHDFRDSMLQMILEKEIYAWDDLRELLHRFLSLNSPYHHDSILRAFTEIWNDVFSSSAAAAATAKHGGPRRKSRNQHT